MSRPTDSDDVLAIAQAWLAEGRELVLATLVRAWGSAPCPVGSQLLADGSGNFVGSVSGGCAEGAVLASATEVLGGAPPRVLNLGVSDESACSVGLVCGGTLQVYVEPLRTDATWQALFEARADRRSVVWATWLATGEHGLIDPALPDGELEPALLAAAQDALARDRAAVFEGSSGEVFLRPDAPPLRLAIVGAVHIAQALASIATLLGFEVVVIDPRAAYATPERFPAVQLVHGRPDEALGELQLDRRSAVVTLTHDPELDDAALLAALASDAFYVGALGSRKSHAARLVRLAEAGISESDQARVRGPVGLAIGAQGPAEIATSIAAELVQVLRYRQV